MKCFNEVYYSYGAMQVPSNIFRAVAGRTPMDIFESDKEFTITADAPGA